MTMVPTDAQTYSVVHSFTGGDGNRPVGLVLSGTTLFGMTSSGGTSNWGTVFRVNTDGSEFTVLRSFTGPPDDGAAPFWSGALLLVNGSLYGTTYSGGASNYGTVFKLNLDGTGYTVLKSFTGTPAEGANPMGGLAFSEGILYGTTYLGGSSNSGTLFRLGQDGTGFSVVKHFTDTWERTGLPTGEGCGPCGNLAIAGSTLYGTTIVGGMSYNGTIFKVNIDGTGFGVLREGNPTDGTHFQAGLVLGGTTFYGTAPWDGAGGLGTVFKLGGDGGDFTVLRSFSEIEANRPGMLVINGDRLYGTIPSTFGPGALFTVKTDGSDYYLLKRFTPSEGTGPYGALVLSGSTLYGTADGGISNSGVVFRFSLPVPGLVTPPQSQTAELYSTVDFRAGADGALPLVYQWFFNDTNLLCVSTNEFLRLSGVQAIQAGAYSVAVSNSFGAVTSPPAMLNVIAPVPRRTVPGLALAGQAGDTVHLDSTTAYSSSPDWVPLDTVAMASTSQWYFDLSSPLPPMRFYRAWHGDSSSGPPGLRLDLIPALTLTGAIGDSIRVDRINQFGPVDAWVALDTVTLTNIQQLYFDVSEPGQPRRLWRLVPVP